MVELTVICDKCRSVVAVGRAVLDVRAGSLRRKFAQIDLCEGCAGVLQAWLGDRPATDHRPSTPPVAELLSPE